MATPGVFGQTSLVRVPDLLHWLLDGRLQVPTFQRPFVWSDSDRLKLFDSIYQGFPIGSIVVWRTERSDTPTTGHLGPVRLPAPTGQRHLFASQFVLDGTQRLTTLFTALAPALSEEPLRWETPQGSPPPAWRIFVSLDEDGRFATGKDLNLHPDEGLDACPAGWLPLEIVLSPSRLFWFLRRGTRQGLPDSVLNRAQRITSNLQDYTIPVITTSTDDLEVVTQVFQRINASGTLLSRQDMLQALTWSDDLDLAGRRERLKRDPRSPNLSTLTPELHTDVIAALAGLRHAGQSAEEITAALSTDPSLPDQAEHALRLAASALAKLGLLDLGLAPYSGQVVMLAEVLHRTFPYRDPGQPLPAHTMTIVVRWFWSTSLSMQFDRLYGAAHLKVRAELLERLQERAASAPPEPPRFANAIDRFDLRSARGRTFALLIATLNPLSPDLKHIDGPGALARHRGHAFIRLLHPSGLPKQLVLGPANRFLVPPNQAPAFRDALLNNPMAAPPRFLKSHAIPKAARDRLASGDLAGFLRLRLERIHDLEEAKATEVGLRYVRPDPMES